VVEGLEQDGIIAGFTGNKGEGLPDVAFGTEDIAIKMQMIEN